MRHPFQVERFTFSSPSDGLTLQAVAYVPEQPQGVVQLVHGMCEYIERYDHVLTFLAENGYIACGYDQRGHGKSAPTKELLGYFGKDTEGEAIVEDAAFFTGIVKERYPNLPVCLYGHSMGSMVSLCYLQKHDLQIDKLILSGTPCRNIVAGAGVLLAKAVKLLKGEMHRSKTLKKLSIGAYQKPFLEEGKCAWLTRDKEVASKYEQNELCRFTFTVNGFINLFSLLNNCYDKQLFAPKKFGLPILFVAGSDDPVIGDKERWEESQSFLRALGYQVVEGNLYQGMRHEPHNEIGKEEVLDDILAFLQK